MAKLLEEQERNRAEIARVEAEREAVIEQSTAMKLERIDQALKKLRWRDSELAREASSVRSSVAIPVEQDERWQKILSLRAEERSIFVEAGFDGVPKKFICENPLEVFSAKLKQEQDELDRLMRPFKGRDHVRPSGRILDRQKELDAMKARWPQIEKSCQRGQRIFQIRQEIKTLVAEREAEREKREQRALSKAKVAELAGV